ncbi:MAG: hypothetical protein NT163_03335 [Chlorobiales bacterium]|nr:hypothetical protein [Chlorobiales bacterium]
MLFEYFLFILAVTGTIAFLARYRKHLDKKRDRRTRETWAIGLYKGPSPLKLFPPEGINNPILSAKDVTDVPARFVADPFMIQNDTGYYLFFEVLNDKRNLGEIAYAFSSDAIYWQYRNVVLKERFHLSYPYVFAWENHYYMIPECNNSGGIQLYEAKKFPEQWHLVATLIKSTGRYSALVDPSTIHYQNRWYLFSYAQKSKNLHLYMSDILTGPWKEHPKSPIVSSSPNYARPGGRVILNNGIIYRYAQDEIPNYGTKVWTFRITELTENTYCEELASEKPVLQPGREWWNKDGMHTVDPHQRETGEWLALVDGFSIHHQPPKH